MKTNPPNHEPRTTNHESRITRRWIGLSTLILLLLVSICLPAASSIPAQTAPAIRFIPVDLYLDSGSVQLGAYQIDIVAPPDEQIVGLEGGESPAFKDAPYYDPAALMGNHIIIAAFSTADALPAGQIRIARLHLQITGDPAPLTQFTTRLVVATDAQGRTIPAKISLRPFSGDKP